MTKQTIIAVGAMLLIIIIVSFFIPGNINAPSDGVVSNEEEVAVRAVVTAFGDTLKQVNLLAETEARTSAMNSAYGEYVTPELLARWYPEGAEGALGRYTSSPYPDRIEITEIHKTEENFVVEGIVIDVTQVQTETGPELAGTYPVTFSMEKREGKWMIVKAEKGAYSDLPQRRTVVGFWECLPHKNTSGPQTMECALGIAIDQSDGHVAVDTRLMSTMPVDFPVGTKVRAEGVFTPATHLSSEQKYDIDGILSATSIVALEE